MSVIVPVYNGSGFLAECVDSVRSYFTATGVPCELLIAEDGSTDGTKALCRELKTKNPDIKLIQDRVRLGRGASLKKAIHMASGDVIMYLDVDMATDMNHVGSLLDHVFNGADIATGSRYLRGSNAERSLLRLLSSKVYNDMVRRILGSKVSDHQCGFKAFKRDAVLSLLPHVKSDFWFWDTEILVRAQREGYKVAEIPIRWHESPHDKSTVKLLNDAVQFFAEILRLRDELDDT